jgi:hypothetical protein
MGVLARTEGRNWDTGNGSDGIYLHNWKDEKAFVEGQHNWTWKYEQKRRMQEAFHWHGIGRYLARYLLVGSHLRISLCGVSLASADLPSVLGSASREELNSTYEMTYNVAQWN